VQIPEGMNEEEVVDIVNGILKTLSYSFRFGYFDLDDIKQQGWIYAIEGFPKYDPKKGPLENFLRSHIRNRFLNLKRDKLSRHTPPCPSCPFFDPNCLKSKNKCAAFEDKRECDKWSGWEDRNMAKKNLVQPLDITNIRDENEKNMKKFTDVHEQTVKSELFSIIDRNLPVNLRSDFRKIMEGVHIPKPRRLKIEEYIRNIIEENYDGETW
tara:strand:- start:424 stop:1056 length:633 start_codon:yes stop_codon:yes gene_type:complete